MLHTILGAGGSIGNSLTDELLTHGEKVRLVSRSGYTQGDSESVRGDLLSVEETRNSVAGSDIVYLCAGLPYSVKIWAEQWPVIMRNTIEACKAANAKLIFLDNVYMYGLVTGPMTETTPYNPCSKKGEIRANIATLLTDEFSAGNLTGCIARAADLYGPYATKTSLPTIMAIEKLLAKKQAQWLVNATTIHSYTYTTDCAKGLYLLAGASDSMNQIWHLPTTNPGINGKTLIEIVATAAGVPSKFTILKKWMVKLAGLVDPTVANVFEMLYQNENDYHFDSTKFNQHFNYQPMPYTEGLPKTVNWIRQHS